MAASQHSKLRCSLVWTSFWFWLDANGLVLCANAVPHQHQVLGVHRATPYAYTHRCCRKIASTEESCVQLCISCMWCCASPGSPARAWRRAEQPIGYYVLRELSWADCGHCAHSNVKCSGLPCSSSSRLCALSSTGALVEHFWVTSTGFFCIPECIRMPDCLILEWPLLNAGAQCRLWSFTKTELCTFSNGRAVCFAGGFCNIPPIFHSLVLELRMAVGGARSPCKASTRKSPTI